MLAIHIRTVLFVFLELFYKKSNGFIDIVVYTHTLMTMDVPDVTRNVHCVWRVFVFLCMDVWHDYLAFAAQTIPFIGIGAVVDECIGA